MISQLYERIQFNFKLYSLSKYVKNICSPKHQRTQMYLRNFWVDKEWLMLYILEHEI